MHKVEDIILYFKVFFYMWLVQHSVNAVASVDLSSLGLSETFYITPTKE